MFIQGQIVKSKLRTETHPLFLMVLSNLIPIEEQIDTFLIEEQFNAVVLGDFGSIEPDYPTGGLADNWNTSNFELSSWDEFKQFL